MIMEPSVKPDVFLKAFGEHKAAAPEKATVEAVWAKPQEKLGSTTASATPATCGSSIPSLSEALISQLSLRHWWSPAYVPAVQSLVAQIVEYLGVTSLSVPQSQLLFNKLWKLLDNGLPKLQDVQMDSPTINPVKTTSASSSVTFTGQTVAAPQEDQEKEKYYQSILYWNPQLPDVLSSTHSAAPALLAWSANSLGEIFSGSTPPMNTFSLPNPDIKQAQCKVWKQLNGKLLSKHLVFHKIFDALDEVGAVGWIAGGAARSYPLAQDIDVFVSGDIAKAQQVATALDPTVTLTEEPYDSGKGLAKVADLDTSWTAKPIQIISTTALSCNELLNGFDLSVHMVAIRRNLDRTLEDVEVLRTTRADEPLHVYRVTTADRLKKIQERYGITAEQTTFDVPQPWTTEEAWQ